MIVAFDARFLSRLFCSFYAPLMLVWVFAVLTQIVKAKKNVRKIEIR